MISLENFDCVFFKRFNYIRIVFWLFNRIRFSRKKNNLIHARNNKLVRKHNEVSQKLNYNQINGRI